MKEIEFKTTSMKDEMTAEAIELYVRKGFEVVKLSYEEMTGTYTIKLVKEEK